MINTNGNPPSPRDGEAARRVWRRLARTASKSTCNSMGLTDDREPPPLRGEDLLAVEGWAALEALRQHGPPLYAGLPRSSTTPTWIRSGRCCASGWSGPGPVARRQLPVGDILAAVTSRLADLEHRADDARRGQGARHPDVRTLGRRGLLPAPVRPPPIATCSPTCTRGRRSASADLAASGTCDRTWT